MGKYIAKIKAVIEEAEIIGIEPIELFKNTIGNLTFNKVSAGNYDVISVDKFNIDTTSVYIQPSDGSSSPTTGMFFVSVIDANTIRISSINVNNDDAVDIDFRHLDFKIKTR